MGTSAPPRRGRGPGRGNRAAGRDGGGSSSVDARFAEILRIAPDAIITLDGNLNIQLFNVSAEQMFGYRADEVAGKPLSMLIPARFRAAHQRHVDGFRAATDTSRRMDQRAEVVGLRKDGTEFPAAASVSKLDDGDASLFTVVLVDVSARKQAEDALIAARNAAEAANLAKSQFLATMSHDLRTPLNSILGFAEVIASARLGPVDDKYREYAKDITQSGEHLLALINLILDLTAVETGNARLIREDVPVADVFDECARMVADTAERRNLKFVILPPDGAPLVHADRRALVQILLNLLSNAIAYTPGGGQVTLSAEAANDGIKLCVADTGHGIPARDLKRILEPFQRGEKDPYKASRGWGLGLAIAKSLVGLHGGRLDITSRQGVGTRVSVTLAGGAGPVPDSGA